MHRVDEAIGRIRAIGGDSLVELMLEIFLVDVPRRVERLRDAASANDRTAVKRIAHSIRGSAATMGLESVARLCLELEAAAMVTERHLQPGVDALADAIGGACETLRSLEVSSVPV